jgi:ABC-2 type transport system permease protein
MTTTFDRPRLSPLVAEATFIKRSLIHTLRTPDALIMATVFPIIMMFLFVFVFGGAIEGDGNYVNYVVPGIILLCAGFGAASVAVDVANDMTAGIIDRFRTMPLRASAVVT